MRSPLGKECRKLFRKLMTVEFPDYREDENQIVPPGWYIWRTDHRSGLLFWLILVIHHSRDEFTTEAGWSFDAIKPSWTGLGNQVMDTILSKPLTFRTDRLWCQSNCGHWWKFVLRPEEYDRALLYKDDPIAQCLPLVAPAVWDAGEKIKEHVIRVFEAVVRRHGSPREK